MRIHHVFANRANVGDWLSAQGIQLLVREHLAEVGFIEHLCDDPFVDDTLRDLERASDDELILVGGGGLFMDYFAPLWEGLSRLVSRRPVAIWGVGYVDLKHEPSRPPLGLLRAVVAGARLTVVRDELTRQLLGVALPEPVPCPSLAAVNSLPLGFGVLHVNNYTTVGAEAYEAMRATGQALAAATHRPYRETNNRIEPGRSDHLDALLERYRRSDIVLSSALHGCVLAVAMGRPVIAVSGDRKIEAFMTSAGLDDWVLGQDELDQIPQVFERLERQSAASAFVADAVGRNRAIAREVAGLAAPTAAGVTSA